MQIRKTLQAASLAGLCALSSCSVLAIAFQKIPEGPPPTVALPFRYITTTRVLQDLSFSENLTTLAALLPFQQSDLAWVKETIKYPYKGPTHIKHVRYELQTVSHDWKTALEQVDRNGDHFIILEEVAELPKLVLEANQARYDALLSPKNL